MKDALDGILTRVRRTVDAVDLVEVAALGTAIERATAVHVGGVGRSGLVARMLAARLVQVGRLAHVVFETTAPAPGPDDLVVMCSGSGTSETLLPIAERTLRAGTPLAVITANPLSPLGRMADLRLTVPPILPGPVEPSAGERGVLVPMQTLFEQSLVIVLDGICDRLSA